MKIDENIGVRKPYIPDVEMVDIGELDKKPSDKTAENNIGRWLRRKFDEAYDANRAVCMNDLIILLGATFYPNLNERSRYLKAKERLKPLFRQGRCVFQWGIRGGKQLRKGLYKDRVFIGWVTIAPKPTHWAGKATVDIETPVQTTVEIPDNH